jgi:hypothetical protein
MKSIKKTQNLPFEGYTPHPGEEPEEHGRVRHPEEGSFLPGGDEPGDELLQLFGRRESVPLDESRLPLIMQEYLQLAGQCTDARPGVLLTAFLPFMGVNLGNRMFMVNNSVPVFPNIWGCVVGPSSFSRKTTALRFADYTIRPYEDPLLEASEADFEQNTMRLDGVTLAKLYSLLTKNPARLFVHHELSAWLSEMNKPFNLSYKQSLTQLFDGESRSQLNMERVERIIEPALSIAAATTEGWLYQHFHSGPELLSGFLQRFIFHVVRGVNLDEIDLQLRENGDLREKLAWFDANVFRAWRDIPKGTQLRLGPDAKILRNREYERRYRRCFQRKNDVLMSYFTRIYDVYWFKFCMLALLSNIWAHVTERWREKRLPELFESLEVSEEEARQAMYMCDFYMASVQPLLAIMDEQDKLSGERKLVELLVNKYGGKAGHTQLMNAARMKKREFGELIESLIERGAVRVENQKSKNGVNAKIYVIAGGIMESHQRTN